MIKINEEILDYYGNENRMTNEEEVSLFEKRYNIKFPNEYREFLLEYNGAELNFPVFKLNILGMKQEIGVTRVLSISDNCGLDWANDEYGEDLLKNYVSICYADDGWITMNCKTGKIYFWAEDYWFFKVKKRGFKIANSFEEFLGKKLYLPFDPDEIVESQKKVEEVQQEKKDIFEGIFNDNGSYKEGTLVKASGDKFEGTFNNDGSYKEGTIVESSGDKFEGTFNTDGSYKEGVFTFNSGTKFEGTFWGNNYVKDGILDYGDYGWAKGIFNDTGYYNGALVKGTMVTPVGKFTGTLESGKYKEGTLEYSDGRIFKGVFITDQTKEGTMTYPSGKTFEGTFRGSGPIKHLNGEKFEGTFRGIGTYKEGELVHPTKLYAIYQKIVSVFK